jgi:mono/diheme cytochrome c family protein
VAALSVVSTACLSGRYTSAGFHLPVDGNSERGKAAFVALGCHSCHEVAGVDLPRPTILPAVNVILGGEVDRRPSDAYLVTSIIDPSYELALYPKSQITVDGHSRMPSYADRISARQIVDIVSFLQSRYETRVWAPRYVYPGMPG